MSNAHYVGRPSSTVPMRAPLRVRDQAREVAAVIAFSAVTATCLALVLLALTQLARRG